MADAPTSPNPNQMIKQLTELWTKLGKRRKLAIVGVAVVILGGVLWTSLAHHGDNWSPIAESASPDDASELYSLLQARDLPVRLKDGKVEVENGHLSEARAIAAAAGLPRSGKGLETFETSSLGQSSFAEQVNYRRALQTELARSISSIAQVDSARVHLALGKRSVFKDQEELPSASVALRLHPGQQLTAEQVRGVRQLVAASVEGLKPDAVAIVDNHGNLLDSHDADASDRKAEIERGVDARVRAMLERVVGPGKVSVVSTADVDERRTSETQDIYDKDKEAVRSESRTVDGPDATTNSGGVAGARGNLPGTPGASSTPGQGAPGKLSETRNYEVSHTVRQIASAPSQLVRLHVAVLVDYKTGADGKPVARDAKDMQELTALARQAAGIDDSRGDQIEVHATPFAPDTESPATADAAAVPPAAELPIIPIAIGGGALLFVIFVVVMLKKRGAKKAKALAEAKAVQQALALPTPVAELERVLEARPQLEHEDTKALPPGRTVHDRVVEAIEKDVERAASVLSAWLAEPPPKTEPARGAKA